MQRPLLRRPRFVAAVLVSFALLLAGRAGAGSGSLSGRILNADKSPAPGARVRLFLDDVDAEPRAYKELKSLTTDESGTFEFPDLPKAYYLVVADREGAARTFRAFVLEDGSRLSHDFVLKPPVRPALVVRDEAGRPIAGARIRSLDSRDDNGEFWLRTRAHWELFATPPALPEPSDGSGRIDLPELPEGAVVDAVIGHPDLAPARVKDVPARPGVIAEPVLRPGIPVTLRIAADAAGTRPDEAIVRLFHDDLRHPSSLLDHRLPIDAEGLIRFTVEPGRYEILQLTHERYHFTPTYAPAVSKGEYLRLGEGAPHEFPFVPHRKIKVRGRVVAADGQSVAEAYILGEIPNVGPDGRVPEGEDEWAYAGWGETDENGEYVVSLAAGRARLSFQSKDYLPETTFTEFDVAPDGSTAAPDIRLRPMPRVSGRVVDAAGRPAPGAIVRLRGLLRHTSPTTTDDQGRFELSPPWIPIDYETEEPKPVQPLIAFHPHERLSARADTRLDDPDSLNDITLTLAQHAPGALIGDFHDELTATERGDIPKDRLAEMAAATLKGQPAPNLDGTWLNIDPPPGGLAAFRGKYVLLDFWFIGCGPCHADYPSVQLLHDLYKDRGLVVVAVHDNSASADAVRAYAEKEGMTVPILVDHADNRTNLRYEGRGLSGYPSHILIAPDGTVLDDDRTTPGPSLRTYKLELIRELLLP